jgi:hypothetical protein
MLVGPIMQAKLPKFLKPTSTGSFVRLGKNNDGGYIIDKNAMQIADCLVSLGISNDWNFEKDFFQATKRPVIAFDGSISFFVFAKKVAATLLRVDKPYLVFQWIYLCFDYLYFFTGHKNHIKQFIGPEEFTNHLCLSDAIEDYVPAYAKKILFKIDIEGGEYRILEEILLFQERICFLAIEFHDCDLHSSKIKDFIERFSLSVCHVHCNNWGEITASGMPQALELCFNIQSNTIPHKVNLPTELDQPNNPKSPDISIQFRDE